uniref:Uncharacterized protein n=1 Tax=Rhipicephalus zambeziensis TaxID=60191 RepID=A0A224YAM5_9ACAR
MLWSGTAKCISQTLRTGPHKVEANVCKKTKVISLRNICRHLNYKVMIKYCTSHNLFISERFRERFPIMPVSYFLPHCTHVLQRSGNYIYFKMNCIFLWALCFVFSMWFLFFAYLEIMQRKKEVPVYFV